MHNLDIVLLVVLSISLVIAVGYALDQRSQRRHVSKLMRRAQSMYNEAHRERMSLRKTVEGLASIPPRSHHGL